jgi:hypothetical protein
MKEKLRNEKLVFYSLLFCILLTYPAVSIFNYATLFLGIPTLYLFIFSVWIFMIFMLFFLVRKDNS